MDKSGSQATKLDTISASKSVTFVPRLNLSTVVKDVRIQGPIITPSMSDMSENDENAVQTGQTLMSFEPTPFKDVTPNILNS